MNDKIAGYTLSEDSYYAAHIVLSGAYPIAQRTVR